MIDEGCTGERWGVLGGFLIRMNSFGWRYWIEVGFTSFRQTGESYGVSCVIIFHWKFNSCLDVSH